MLTFFLLGGLYSVTPGYIQWSILGLSYQTRRKESISALRVNLTQCCCFFQVISAGVCTLYIFCTNAALLDIDHLTAEMIRRRRQAVSW